MATVAGRYVVDREIWGGAEYGLVRAHDAAGQRYLVSVCGHYAPRLSAIEELLARYRHLAGVGDVVETFTLDGRDILVEAEPDGRPSDEHPPLSPSAARRLALALGERLLSAGPGVYGVRPELVYIDGDRLCGIAPGYMAMAAHGNPTLTGGLPLYPVSPLSREEALGQPPTRAHDAYVLAYMLRYWLTASALLGPADSFLRRILDIIEGKHCFHYDGPLHDVVDGGLRSTSTLDEMLDVLTRVELDAADADHAIRARLVAEIVARPDDDEPRLILADHLQERGDPRGHFIVAQCGGQPVDALLAAHGARWSAYLADDASEAFFTRGFVSHVRGAHPADLARRRDALLSFGPIPTIF